MKLNVKILGGVECELHAEPHHTVDHLKAQIQAKLQLDIADQKILFKGKALQDGTPLSQYNLCDGSKLNLVVKREATLGSGASSSVDCRAAQADFRRQVFLLLRPHFKSDLDTEKVAAEFQREFEKRLSCLSLDDWERISRHFNLNSVLHF